MIYFAYDMLFLNNSIVVVANSNVVSLSAALSCLVYPPQVRGSSGEGRGLLSRTAPGNRA